MKIVFRLNRQPVRKGFLKWFVWWRGLFEMLMLVLVESFDWKTRLDSVFVFDLYFSIARWAVCGKLVLMWKRKIGLSWHNRVLGWATAVTGVFAFLWFSMSVTFSLPFYIWQCHYLEIAQFVVWHLQAWISMRCKLFVAVLLRELFAKFEQQYVSHLWYFWSHLVFLTYYSYCSHGDVVVAGTDPYSRWRCIVHLNT